MDAQTYIGMDISKDTLEIEVRPGGEHWQEANDEPGTRQPGHLTTITVAKLKLPGRQSWSGTRPSTATTCCSSCSRRSSERSTATMS
jgi:hypothetical protein